MATTTILITRPCPVCGQTTELELDTIKLERWQSGEFVQNVWPEATADWRELFITGTHGPCWDKLFPLEGEE